MAKKPLRALDLAGGGEVLFGMILTAIGRGDGPRRFGATREAFLASLAPLIAFPLVAAGLRVASGGAVLAAAQFLGTLCILLVPLVVSFELARLWKRSDLWPRYATAFNWCQWVVALVAFLCMAILAPALHGGHDAELAAAGLFGAYAFWLHWFIARRGLNLSVLRAIGLVAASNAAAALILFLPALLANRGM